MTISPITVNLRTIRIHTRHDVADALAIATTIIDPHKSGIPTDEENDSAHWTRRSVTILTGAILHAVYATPELTLHDISLGLSVNKWQRFVQDMATTHHPMIQKIVQDFRKIPLPHASAEMSSTCYYVTGFVHHTANYGQNEGSPI